MSPRKIIFLVVIGLVGLICLYLLYNLSQSNKKVKEASVDTLSVWVVGDTSAQYEAVLEGFRSVSPIYRNTQFDIRVFPDYEKYQRILLSTLAEGTGPDLFMIEAGGDDILQSKAEPIPDGVIDLSNFERDYEEIFLTLLLSEGEGKNLKRSILGIPLGYETLGVFYHKSLIENFPQTWAEVSLLDISNERGKVLSTNLGLNPIYSLGGADIITYFLGKGGIVNTEGLGKGSRLIGEYLSYAPPPTNEGEIDIVRYMDENSLTAADLFVRGRIALFIGFPSVIRELEKAEKRAGDELYEGLVLTERLPRESLGVAPQNIARYRYLALSRKSEKPLAAADLMNFLMSRSGSMLVQEQFPLLISPFRSESINQKTTRLSRIYARTTLDAFIPILGEEVFLYNYNLKSVYEKMFREYIDRNGIRDINTFVKTLQNSVICEVSSVLEQRVIAECLE